MGWGAIAFAVGTALYSAYASKKADDKRKSHAQDQFEEIERAVGEALFVNKRNLERSRIRTKEQISRSTLDALGTLRNQVATRVGRSSDAMLSSALASGTLASLDVDAQTEMQSEVLESQAEQQIAGIPVPQSTPGIFFTGGLAGLQTGLSIASSAQTVASG